ncbi:MAG: MFS transporter, partial [Hydrogenophilales bacterium]|nr:MFS transporter [Hydrogenophilales bacterium]
MYATLTPQRERFLLLTLAGIQFSHILDFMIMMPLGPILMAAFGIGTHEFGLLVASYSFSAALSGLFAATFVDRFERKRLLLVMFALFGLATLTCGLAPGYATLLIARGLAGVFGGVMGAMVQTMIGDVIPFARRAKAGSFVSAAFSLSTVAGVPLSLWLANHLGWRAPFVLIAAFTVLFIIVGLRILPELRHHIGTEKHAHPFSAMFAVLRDANHLRALLFGALIIFSGFMVIPYITIYAVSNVGISQHDIPFVYLAGGAATLISGRLIGHWADLRGKIKIYRLVAAAALLPLFVVTQAGVVPLWLWLICTTTFFVLVSGRMIP